VGLTDSDLKKLKKYICPPCTEAKVAEEPPKTLKRIKEKSDDSQYSSDDEIAHNKKPKTISVTLLSGILSS